jgi:flavin-dependent dehydrogenase
VLLVGDASGYVDAITGEGLRLGFDQARHAVEHVVDGGGYDAAWARTTRDFRVLTSRLVRAATGPVRGAIVPTAALLPGAFGAVVEKLAR